MKMKKIFGVLLTGVLAASVLAGCGSSGSSSSASSSAAQADTQTEDVQTETAQGTETEAASVTETASGNSKSLIVYFDYSENMGDTSDMDADAITSASLDGMTIDGVTENDLLVMRDEIQKQTGADTFSVRVTEPYDPTYENMVNVAQDDQDNDKQFTFVEDLPDLSGYDTIYLGMPVWWGGLPQPMVNLLEENDFSGLTIIPFGINLGSGFGNMINQIEEAQPAANVIEDGLTENSHTPNDEVVSDVDSWLDELSSNGTITLK